MVKIWRSYDAREINAVLNEPRVRPWVADAKEGVLDISAKVANKGNVLLMGQWGGFVCLGYGAGIYEVHTQVLPEGRGAWTSDFAAAGFHYMFTRTDCVEIITRVPQGHVAAKALTEHVGFRYEFTRHNECLFRGNVVDVSIYSRSLMDWVKDAPGLIERGQWLHDEMRAQAKALGVTEQPHDDDENHNRYAGAAVEMALGGQAMKGVNWYNRWALACRHSLIALVSKDPPTVKFDIGYLRLQGEKIEVLREAA